MRNSLVIFFIILLTYFSQMSNSKADCRIHEGVNIKDSFGIQICSMPGVDNKYLLHAKNVMDNILDYDGDEYPDNQLVIENIMRTGSVFVVFNNEREIGNFEEMFYIGIDEIINNECEELSDTECESIIEKKHGIFISVFKDEMNLSNKGWDPTKEEALHLITHAGYSKVYPEDFGQSEGSKIATFMDVARGGKFNKIPRKYPKNAYYTYYDRSCDYACQITEFTFWAISSLRGEQIGREKDIKDEWKPNTPKKIRELDPDLVDFLSRDEFGILF